MTDAIIERLQKEKIALINALIEERALRIYYGSIGINKNTAIEDAKKELRKEFKNYPGVEF